MRNKRFQIGITTTLFALLLWFSVSMSDEYQVQVSAPLVIQGLPAGKALAHPLPRAVRLTFKEFGWRLVKLVWKSDIQWVVDLNTLPNARLLTLDDFAEQLGNRLGVQPVAMTPESLPIELDSIGSKRIPIVPNYAVTFRKGYGQVGPVLVFPESVTVTGAKSLLHKVERWYTSRQTFESVRQTIDTKIRLADTTSTLTFTPDDVSVRLIVQQFAEKAFNGIAVEVLSTPENRDIILSSPSVDIVVHGGIEQLSGVTQKQFRAVVDYRTILADTSGIVEPEIRMPGGLQIVRRTPDRLSYVVRKKF